MIFFLLEAIITTNNKQHIDGSGVARLNREAGRAGAVPPLCQRANLQETSLRKLGKAQRSDELEPGELPDRRSPSDLRAMGRGSAPCDWFASFGCCSSDGFVRTCSTACGKARIFCSLSFLYRKRGCFYFANVKGRNAPSSQTSSRMPCTSIASTGAAEKCFQQMGTAAENSYFQMG